METKIWNETKIPTLIGLIFEGIFLIAVLSLPFLGDVLNGNGEQEIVLTNTLETISTLTAPILVFGLVLFYAFIKNFNGYRNLYIQGAAPSDAYNYYLFQLIYGIVALFFNPITGIAYIASYTIGASKAKYYIENL